MFTPNLDPSPLDVHTSKYELSNFGGKNENYKMQLNKQ